MVDKLSLFSWKQEHGCDTHTHTHQKTCYWSERYKEPLFWKFLLFFDSCRTCIKSVELLVELCRPANIMEENVTLWCTQVFVFNQLLEQVNDRFWAKSVITANMLLHLNERDERVNPFPTVFIKFTNALQEVNQTPRCVIIIKHFRN